MGLCFGLSYACPPSQRVLSRRVRGEVQRSGAAVRSTLDRRDTMVSTRASIRGAHEGPRSGPARSVLFIAFAFYPASWVRAGLRRLRFSFPALLLPLPREPSPARLRAARRACVARGAGPVRGRGSRRPNGDAAQRRRRSAWAHREAGWDAERAGLMIPLPCAPARVAGQP